MSVKRNIDPELLRAFVAVVECGGFSRAAQRLLRGQSAVSLQIKRLEDHLGVKLLERSPRHLALTGEGELIIDYARRILSLNDELAARVKEPALSGVVRLGAPEDFATSHLPGVLARFARSHPQVALEVTCELTLDLLARFDAGDLDIALVKREPGVGAEGIRVWREPLVWIAADRQVAETGEALPLAVSPRPCVYRKRTTEALDAVGRTWRIAYTCGSLAGTLAAVRAGLGVTVVPKEMAPADLTVLSDETLGLPDLEDTELALIEAPQLGAAAARLQAYIVRELEHGA
ncbi:MAG: LysR substrate-binding domain-containing protein [Rhodospirillales bacterium]